MDGWWLLFTRWALWPTALSALLGFVAFAVVLVPAEWFCGRRRPRCGLQTDLLFWAFTPVVGKAATFAAVTAVVSWLMRLAGRELDVTSTAGWGPVGRLPLWLQALGALVLADFVFYWTHRLFHTTQLWPFHAVHHSPEHLNWLSSMRFHPVNDVLSRVAQAVLLVLLGFAPVAVLCAVPVVVVFVVVTHTDVPWTWGPLKHILVSPVYHHWHHSSEPEALDKNFAGVFVLWDWLFGTRYMPTDRLPTTYGAAGGGTPSGFVALLAYPFLATYRMYSSTRSTTGSGLYGDQKATNSKSRSRSPLSMCEKCPDERSRANAAGECVASDPGLEATVAHARPQSTVGDASERQVVIPCLEPAEAAAILKAALLLSPMRPHPVVILLTACTALVVAIVAVAAWLPLAILGVPLAAVALTTLSVAVHEAADGSLFRRRWTNTAVGFAAGVVTFTPFGSYRRGHRAHHRWAGSCTGRDPTAAPLRPVGANRLLDFALALRIPVLFWDGVYLPYLVYDLRPTDSPRRTAHLLGFAVNLVVIAAAHVLLGSVIGWVPYAIVVVGGFVGWGMLYEELFTRHQHVGLLPLPCGKSRYRTTEQAQFSRSVRIPIPWLFFFFNLHKEHHLFPGLSYRYLPRVRELLRRARPDVAGSTSADRRRPTRAHELLTPQPGDP